MRFVRKPKEVEAMFYDGSNKAAIKEWSNGAVHGVWDFNPTGYDPNDFSLCMETKYGTGYAKPGTWVIKGPCGLFYPCSDKEFKDNYWELK